MATDATTLSRKDFQSDQDVRWCPGCGDYAILAAVQKLFPTLGLPKEKLVVVSGIGCSSRFPYYMDTYGFHTIHGRAPAVATGLKVTRPDLEVWVVTGDGDALSIGGNHLIHALRRNVGLKILLFNNRIYGLTKGQYSPTSEVGKRTSSTPVGSIDPPFDPIQLALGAGASFVARSVDILQGHLTETLERAARHQGTAFIEIYQNCNIFNDKAFAYMTDKENRETQMVQLRHGEPAIFGDSERRFGLRLEGLSLRAVDLGTAEDADDATIRAAAERAGVLVWDETDPMLSLLISRVGPPDLPTPIGVFRAVERPAFETQVVTQIQQQIDLKGAGSLDDLIHGGETWTVGG